MLSLPPPYDLLTLPPNGDAFAHALAVAAERGAGTLVWVPMAEAVDLAVVLEPEEAWAVCCDVLYAGLVAAWDALAVEVPPERPLAFADGGRIVYDGVPVGEVRLAAGEGALPADRVPSHLVLGVRITIEEGFLVLESKQFVEHFARYLMLTLDTWQTAGREAVLAQYRRRPTHA